MQPDDREINMIDAWQVLWWCSYLSVTKTQLEQAIIAAGPVVVDLRQYLGSKHAQAPAAPLIKALLGANHAARRSTPF